MCSGYPVSLLRKTHRPDQRAGLGRGWLAAILQTAGTWEVSMVPFRFRSKRADSPAVPLADGRTDHCPEKSDPSGTLPGILCLNFCAIGRFFSPQIRVFQNPCFLYCLMFQAVIPSLFRAIREVSLPHPVFKRVFHGAFSGLSVTAFQLWAICRISKAAGFAFLSRMCYHKDKERKNPYDSPVYRRTTECI